MRKRNTPKVVVKKDPFLQGETTLKFDNFDEEQISELTESQKSDKFMSYWLEVIDPFVKYERFFEESDKSHDLNLNMIKNFHVKYVLRGSWSDRKFVMIIDNILINRFAISIKAFEKSEQLYKEGRLPIQLLEKRRSGRRKRI